MLSLGPGDESSLHGPGSKSWCMELSLLFVCCLEGVARLRLAPCLCASVSRRLMNADECHGGRLDADAVLLRVVCVLGAAVCMGKLPLNGLF